MAALMDTNKALRCTSNFDVDAIITTACRRNFPGRLPTKRSCKACTRRSRIRSIRVRVLHR